jgi:hypothetical protein
MASGQVELAALPFGLEARFLGFADRVRWRQRADPLRTAGFNNDWALPINGSSSLYGPFHPSSGPTCNAKSHFMGKAQRLPH